MNQILRRSLGLNRVLISSISSSNRVRIARLSTKDNNDDHELKEIIEGNEANYFAKVKSSFDRLQKSRENESSEAKRSRLMYQSRKRGISENGLILANFSAEYLNEMNDRQLDEYDKIINGLHNEWDLYYWLTDAVPTPDEFKSLEILELMKKFVLNPNCQSRIVQPEINLVKK